MNKRISFALMMLMTIAFAATPIHVRAAEGGTAPSGSGDASGGNDSGLDGTANDPLGGTTDQGGGSGNDTSSSTKPSGN